MSDDIQHASDEFDPLKRELCPEGTCIGVIGPDGTCKECGRPGLDATVDPRYQGLRADDEPAGELDAAAPGGAPDDFADRSLCPDGACIGVIGPNGRCNECGQPAAPAPG